MLPITIAIIMLMMFAGTVGDILGVGPIAEWIRNSFAEATVWWHKALIGLGGLTLFGGALVAVYRGGKWLYSQYRGW